MINLTTIQDIIYDWVSLVTSRELYWEDQNNAFPEESKPCFTAKITTFTSPNHVNKSQVDTVTGIRTLTSDEDFVVMFRGFGTGIYIYALQLHKSVHREDVKDLLATAGVVVVNWLMVENTSGLDNTENEERVDLDITLRIGNEDTETVGVIEEVNATGTITNAKTGDKIIDLTVEKP